MKNSFTNRHFTGIITIVLTWAVASTAFADFIELPVKWSQPIGFDQNFFIIGQDFLSDDTVKRVMSDDFQSDGRPIFAVRWWGSYRGDGTQRPKGIVGPFHIIFHRSVGGHPDSLPGSLLKEYAVNAQQDPVARDATGNFVYRYDAMLPSPFNEQRSVEYFVDIDKPTNENWGWHETPPDHPILDFAARGGSHLGPWATDPGRTDLAFELMSKQRKGETKPNGSSGPRTGEKDSPQMAFNAGTGLLSFTDGVIDFANLVGDESLDPLFATDAILGATIRVSDMTLSGPAGNGFLFTGGSMTIFNNGQTLLAADIPELLIDDTGLALSNINIFGPLDVTDYDFLGSPFLEAYLNFYGTHSNQFPPELFGRTSFPVADLIRNGQSFNTAIHGYGLGNSTPVPEPSTIGLLIMGAFSFLGYRVRLESRGLGRARGLHSTT